MESGPGGGKGGAGAGVTGLAAGSGGGGGSGIDGWPSLQRPVFKLQLPPSLQKLGVQVLAPHSVPE